MLQPAEKPYLTYALDANGKLTHIDKVSTGLACNCFCPHCKSELIAKNGGSRKAHHFAHANGSDCVGAIESALHKMAKDILQEHKLIMLPIQDYRAESQMMFVKVDVEAYDKELSLRPDCIGHIENGRQIWVEFKRSHEVDVKKAGKIISAKIDCIEIDINSCELDPQKLRSFIETSYENRKWIYNHDNPQVFQFSEKDYSSQPIGIGDCYNSMQIMSRHIAIDEQNTIVNLRNIHEIDFNKHTYFCIACDKEVFITVDDYGNYSFTHLDEHTPCEDNFYLHEAAKKVLYWKFYTQQTFDTYIPQLHICDEGRKCSLFNYYYCSIDIPLLYDLKALGYDSCKIEYKFPNNQFPYDIVLQRGDDLKTAIVIIINAITCHIEPENLKNRAIEIIVRREKDVFKLLEEPLHGNDVRYFNFRHSYVKTTSWQNVKRVILKFTLFSSGKYYFGVESCMSMSKKSAIYEMDISKWIRNFKSYGKICDIALLQQTKNIVSMRNLLLFKGR